MRKGDFVWGTVLAAVISLFIFPSTSAIIFDATENYSYLMGFIKFAILATMGEFLTMRLKNGFWKKPNGLPYKALVWGIFGVLTVLMFNLYSAGVASVSSKGLLFVGGRAIKPFMLAFWTSTIMNLTFGPVFMAVHRIIDMTIIKKSSGESVHISEVITEIDWDHFITFIVGKTIPLFWIPAHTLAFLLPSRYRVVFAALLSIVLGVILSWQNRKIKSDTA